MELRHLLALGVWAVLLVRGKNKEEVMFVFESSETLKSEKVRLEFLEDTAGQTYLDVVTFRDRFVLDLLLLNTELRESKVDTNPENAYLCPRTLLENFGLRGLTTPILTPVPPRFCPAMKQSCCLPNDIEDLETLWRDKFSPKVRYVQYYFGYFARDLLAHHPQYLELAAGLARNHKRAFCRDAAQRLLDLDFASLFNEKTEQLLKDFLDFDLKLKRGFMCLLCDYANLGDFDFDSQVHALHHDTCLALVDHAVAFQRFAHRHLFRYINTVSSLAHCQRSFLHSTNLTSDEPPLVFLPVDDTQDLEVCHYAKEHGFNTFANCLNFCATYKLWRPEFPSYPPLDRLAQIHTLAHDFLFSLDDSLVVSAPQQVDFAEVVPSQRDRLSLFQRWESVFTDARGARFAHIADLDSPEF